VSVTTLTNTNSSCVLHDICRFVNELSTRSVVTAAIFEHGKKLTADDDTAKGKPVVTEVNESAPKDPVVAYLIMNGYVIMTSYIVHAVSYTRLYCTYIYE
jgi:hypothetical protein